MTDLDDLLERATDRIAAPDLARQALIGARRRRTRNRGAVAAAVAVAAVVAVVVSVELTTGGARVDPAPAHTGSPRPTPSEEVLVAPAIRPAAIQPVWDPRGAEGLPVTDLGVPRVMETLVPGAVARPVAVLDDGERSRLVSADGRSESLELPAGMGGQRTVSLSPDGTHLAAAGISGLYVRTLTGDWRRLGPAGEGVGISWAADDTPRRSHEEPIDPSTLGPLENLQRPVVSATSIAAARANVSWPEEREPDDYDGLIALDRRTMETRGFLRVPDQVGYYVDGGTLTPIAWLDDDTVAFTVLPKDAPKAYLLTWDVETGELSRISCWLEDVDAVFATELLGR